MSLPVIDDPRETPNYLFLRDSVSSGAVQFDRISRGQYRLDVKIEPDPDPHRPTSLPAGLMEVIERYLTPILVQTGVQGLEHRVDL